MFNLFRRKQQPPSPSPVPFDSLAQILGLGAASSSGQIVTPERALQEPTVYACVRILTESVAQLPVKIYRRVNGVHEPVESGKLFDLLQFPNSWQDSFQFRAYMMRCLLLYGNFFALKTRQSGGLVTELMPLDPQAVSVSQQGYKVQYSYTMNGGRTVVCDSADMLHILGETSRNGIRGDSPVMINRNTIGLALATAAHGARIFRNGARPSGVLKHPGKLSDEALEHLKQSWLASHSGDNAGGTAILEEGMSFDPVSMTNEDAQYLQTRKLQRDMICGIFRVPPHMVADLEKSSFNNIEHQSLEFVKYSVLPWARRIETAIWHSLLTPKQRAEGLHVEFLLDGLERADIASRYGAYNTAINAGILSANECRALENRNPRDGGDVYLQPLNMTDSSQADNALRHQGLSDVLDRLARLSPIPEPTIRSAEKEDEAEHEHDDWAAGEWSEESADLNRIMQELRVRLVEVYRELVAKEIVGVRKLVDEYFPKEVFPDGQRSGAQAKDSVKATEGEFMEALRVLYARYLPWKSTVEKYDLYTNLAAQVVAMAGRQVPGVDSVKVLKQLRATAPEYAAIEVERYVERALGQMQSLVNQGGDVRQAINKRLDEWNATKAKKMSTHAAVCAANWYARECYELSGVQKIKWVTNGSKTCGFCAKLSGRVVGIKEVFAGKGEVFQDGDKASLKTRRKLKHPPLHRGCVCAIVPMQVETIAGVDQGEPMDFERADKGHVNPHYGDGDSGFLDNCQTCVVAYEARCRGYDVEAKSFRGNATMDMLASDQTLAWIDPETGKRPVMTRAGKSAQDVIAFLKEKTKPGERYVLSVQLPGMRHIMHVFRETEDINIFDAQSGSTLFAGDEEILELFNVIGVKFKSQPKFMRVDHLQFNKEIVDKILQKATT